MTIITVEARGDAEREISIGYTWPGRAFWDPYPHSISYSWASRNDWMVPPWLSKPPEIGDPFQSEELPDSVIETGIPFRETIRFSVGTATLKSVIPAAAIEDFKNSGFNMRHNASTHLERRTVGATHRDEWYSYAGLYLVYTTWVQPFIKSTQTRYFYTLRRNTCSNKNFLPEGVAVIDEDCGEPLPQQDSNIKSARSGTKRRLQKMSGCCSCSNIADMLAAQTVNIKEMFDRQNVEIGETLTDQTKFLQDQMIALAPKGFDYTPIQAMITDARNDIWNGLEGE